MRHWLRHVGLVLLLLVAQQGAVVHELGHVSEIGATQVKVAPGIAGSPCALCPAFAQVVTPAFSHAFHIPRLVRAVLERSVEALYRVVDAAVPTPRSRGPPANA